jgi:hypothetical protein
MDANLQTAKNVNAVHDATNDALLITPTNDDMQHQRLPNELLIIILGYAPEVPTTHCNPVYTWPSFMGWSFLVARRGDTNTSTTYIGVDLAAFSACPSRSLLLCWRRTTRTTLLIVLFDSPAAVLSKPHTCLQLRFQAISTASTTTKPI